MKIIKENPPELEKSYLNIGMTDLFRKNGCSLVYMKIPLVNNYNAICVGEGKEAGAYANIQPNEIVMPFIGAYVEGWGGKELES